MYMGSYQHVYYGNLEALVQAVLEAGRPKTTAILCWNTRGHPKDRTHGLKIDSVILRKKRGRCILGSL